MKGWQISYLHASTLQLRSLTPFVLSVGRAAPGVEGSARTGFCIKQPEADQPTTPGSTSVTAAPPSVLRAMSRRPS